MPTACELRAIVKTRCGQSKLPYAGHLAAKESPPPRSAVIAAAGTRPNIPYSNQIVGLASAKRAHFV